jgi:O-antigen/teichoic acid export membrane protein
VSAPFIADFYKKEQLTMITRAVGLALIINSLGLVQMAKLTISLDFKKLAIASTIAVTLSGLLGIWMAYNGYGVWSLVAQTLLNRSINILILWSISHWHPLWVFSRDSFRTLFGFGSKLLLSSLLHETFTNLYSLVIGKKFANNELGLFSQSSTIAIFPSNNISAVIVRAIYPIQCQMQDDNEKLKYFFRKYLRLSCYVIFPITIGLCALAEPLVRVVLTDKWLPGVPFLQILCIAYMWNPVMMMNSSILNVKGRSDLFLRAEIIKKVTAIAILVASIPFGIKVMCMGLVLYSFADMGIIIFYTKRLMDLGFSMQIKALLPVSLLSATMGLLAWGSTLLFSNLLLQLVVGVLVGIVYYVLVSKVARFEEFDFLVSLVRKKKGLSDL